jgi:ABC-type glycerol-3-phosphate transport system permease component
MTVVNKKRALPVPLQLSRWLMYAGLSLAAFVWIYPFLWMLANGLSGESLGAGGYSLIPKSLTLDNFSRAWTTANFSRYFLNTVIVSVSVTVLVLFTTSTSAYVFARREFPGKRLLLALIVGTAFLPSGYSMIPIFDLITRMGLNNTLLGVILAEAGPAHVSYILLFSGYFLGLPRELEESATIDGASPWQTFWYIMLPLARPMVATVGIFQFLAAWNSFLVPYIFTLARPDLRTLGVGMFNFFGEAGTDWTGLAAGACIALIPVIIVFVIFQRQFVRGLEGAVKT